MEDIDPEVGLKLSKKSKRKKKICHLFCCVLIYFICTAKFLTVLDRGNMIRSILYKNPVILYQA